MSSMFGKKNALKKIVLFIKNIYIYIILSTPIMKRSEIVRNESKNISLVVTKSIHKCDRYYYACLNDMKNKD